MAQGCEEHDEVRRELEALKEDHRAKAVMIETFKRAQDEQHSKLIEAKVRIEQQDREIDTKSQEMAFTLQLYQDLKSESDRKESLVKNLGLANEKLRTSFEEKLLKLEEEKEQLAFGLQEEKLKNEDQGRIIEACKEEITMLEDLLLQSQKKCNNAKQGAQALKEVRRREELLLHVEEEKRMVENKFKWKKEQFMHLQEAHEKIRGEFLAANKEWQLERSALLDKITSIETKLDSHMRDMGDLRSRLEMCNQALAREEGRRRLLEIQISELKARYDYVIVDFEKNRTSAGLLEAEQAEEIASMRNLLASKETHVKELETRNAQNEMKEIELQRSLKDLQEAKLNGEEASSSLKALRQKFKQLKQTHSSCFDRLKSKESEWRDEKDKLVSDLGECTSKLILKEEELRNMDKCDMLLIQEMARNEELLEENVLLKSRLQEFTVLLEKELQDAHGKERITLLTEKLDKMNNALMQAQAEIKIENESNQALQLKIEYLEIVERDQNSIKEKVHMYKAQVEELHEKLDFFKEQATLKEKEMKIQLQRSLDAFHGLELSFKEKTHEIERYQEMLQEASARHFCLREEALIRETELLGSVSKTSDELLQSKEELIQQKIEMEKVESKSKQMKIALEQLEKEKMEIQTIKNNSGIEILRSELAACLHTRIEEAAAMERERGSFHQKMEKKDRRIEELEEFFRNNNNQIRRILEAHIVGEMEMQFKASVLVELIDQVSILEQNLDVEKRVEDELRKEIKQKTNEKILAEKELASLQCRNTEMEARIHRLEDDLKGLHRTLEEFKGKALELHRDIEKAAMEDEVLAEMLEKLTKSDREEGAVLDGVTLKRNSFQFMERTQPLKECNC